MKNFKLIAISIVVAVVGFYFILSSVKEPEKKSVNKDVAEIIDKTSADDLGDLEQINKKSTKETSSEQTLNPNKPDSQKMPQVDYSLEQVFKLSEIYPKDKEKLLQIAKSPNPFLEEKIEVKPHSVQDLKQEEFGAIKVMAMRTILEQEKDKSVILDDLSDIIREAQDPTIVAIAKSMKQSVTNNGDFAKDVTDALNNLPLEDDPKDTDHN